MKYIYVTLLSKDIPSGSDKVGSVKARLVFRNNEPAFGSTSRSLIWVCQWIILIEKLIRIKLN